MKQALIIICGQVGAGKSTTAAMLSSLIKAPSATVDTILKRLLANPSFVGKDVNPNPEEVNLCYNTFEIITDYVLSTASSIIIDGVFTLNSQRDQLIDVAKKHGCPHYIIQVTCPPQLLKERVQARFKAGKGVGYLAHLNVNALIEPLKHEHYVIDTSNEIRPQLEKFIAKHLE